MSLPRTLFEKIWDQHTIVTNEGGQTLLYVDWLLCSEGSIHAFNILRAEGEKVRCPERVFGVADHYPASGGPTMADVLDDERRNMIATLDRNTQQYGIQYFGLGDPRRGIQHLVGPEQGLAQPGVIILCGDSHTSTQAAVGAIAFGIGGELAHVLATQTIWQRKPANMRVTVEGKRPPGVAAKDVILAIIAKVGAGGAVQHAIEYAGSTIRDMSVEERMTVCNMSIEGGARCGYVNPDEKTFAYLQGRPYCPSGEAWAAAVAGWASFASDADAVFDDVVEIDAADIAPSVTWGISPDQGFSIAGHMPDPAQAATEAERISIEEALEYMKLPAGAPIKGTPIDVAFIGSCTNGRLSDFREVAKYLQGHQVAAGVTAIAVPGSQIVDVLCRQEGLDQIFRDAGFEWRGAGCSMCLAMNPDKLIGDQLCASSSNRNFKGRQGSPTGRTVLMSPLMVAAAAVTGAVADAREVFDLAGLAAV